MKIHFSAAALAALMPLAGCAGHDFISQSQPLFAATAQPAEPTPLRIANPETAADLVETSGKPECLPRTDGGVIAAYPYTGRGDRKGSFVATVTTDAQGKLSYLDMKFLPVPAGPDTDDLPPVRPAPVITHSSDGDAQTEPDRAPTYLGNAKKLFDAVCRPA